MAAIQNRPVPRRHARTTVGASNGGNTMSHVTDAILQLAESERAGRGRDFTTVEHERTRW